jgi:hypothetical protein
VLSPGCAPALSESPEDDVPDGRSEVEAEPWEWWTGMFGTRGKYGALGAVGEGSLFLEGWGFGCGLGVLRVGVTAPTRVSGSGSSSAIALSIPISVENHGWGKVGGMVSRRMQARG